MQTAKQWLKAFATVAPFAFIVAAMLVYSI